MKEPSPYAVIAKVFEQVLEMDAPLSKRLRLLAEAVAKGSPAFSNAVDALVVRLKQADLGKNAPQVGDLMPAFMLPDQDGRLVSLANILASGPTVISLHRGHWCPYCQLTASALAKVQERIGRAHMVAITPENRSYNWRFIERTGIGYRVLTDPDNGYALSINLAFCLDEDFAAMMRSVGQDLAAFRGRTAWVLSVPATYVVNKNGIVVARHVDPDYRRRIEIEDLVAALERAH